MGFDPFEGIKNVPYERPLVDFVDKLIEVAKHNGSGIKVETSADWKTMEFIYRGWKVLYPSEAFEFENQMKKLRRETLRKGITKGQGGAMMQHLMSIDISLYKMIRVIFPLQKWDRKFVQNFIAHFPQFRAYD